MLQYLHASRAVLSVAVRWKAAASHYSVVSSQRRTLTPSSRGPKTDTCSMYVISPLSLSARSAPCTTNITKKLSFLVKLTWHNVDRRVAFGCRSLRKCNVGDVVSISESNAPVHIYRQIWDWREMNTEWGNLGHWHIFLFTLSQYMYLLITPVIGAGK